MQQASKYPISVISATLRLKKNIAVVKPSVPVFPKTDYIATTLIIIHDEEMDVVARLRSEYECVRTNCFDPWRYCCNWLQWR